MKNKKLVWFVPPDFFQFDNEEKEMSKYLMVVYEPSKADFMVFDMPETEGSLHCYTIFVNAVKRWGIPKDRDTLNFVLYRTWNDTSRIWIRYTMDEADLGIPPIVVDVKPSGQELPYNREVRFRDGRWSLVLDDEE
jgi:hypothetical protein